jgi:hypothetical protein
MHSITFNSEYPEDQQDYKMTVTGEGDFGWSYPGDYLETPEEKMNYALIAYSCICGGEEECHDVLYEIKRVFQNHGVDVNFLEDDYGKPQAIKFYVDEWDTDGVPSAHTDGYIDHQSQPHESDDCERLAKMFRDNPDELYEFVFGDSSIMIDNDNH